MHYKNGRKCQVGDTVIGQTHNSELKLRIGIVTQLMPDQGDCNVKLQLLNSHNVLSSGTALASTVVHFEGKPISIATGIDYADCDKIAHVEDCFKIYEAVIKYGVWDSPYLMAGGHLDVPVNVSLD